jgi:ferredoxin
MLKRLRVGVSVLLFSLITLYFFDFAGLLSNGQFNWLARVQLIPAAIALNILVLAALVAITLLFGRVYCSSICPMGIFQDIVSYLPKRVSKRKKRRYKFSKPRTWLRYSILAIATVASLLGVTLFTGIIDPYSAYGRIAVNLFRPVYLAGNNLLENVFTRFDNYTFYKKDIFVSSATALVVAALTLLIIGWLAWRYGRTYCNTICPAGSGLGILSRFSLFKVRINTQSCNGCGACERKCKASCIDSRNHAIDHSRCVACFDCLGACKTNSLKYALRLKKKRRSAPADDATVNTHRRQFFLATATTVASASSLFAQQKIDALSGDVKPQYKRQIPIAPPGAGSHEHLQSHCTSCHLCISKCPTNVLKPAFMEYGLAGIMQPMMSFDKGYCNYDCTVCSSVCPNNALEKLTVEEKHLTQMGRVHFSPDICVVPTKGHNCGACAEHCPTQAVTMIPYRDGLTIPHINPEICIGCGGCEFICPVRPHRAIFVEGNAIQQQAKPFAIEAKEEVELDEFGF